MRIGVDYKTKIFDVDGKKVKTTIWDTGTELFCNSILIYGCSWSREIQNNYKQLL